MWTCLFFLLFVDSHSFHFIRMCCCFFLFSLWLPVLFCIQNREMNGSTSSYCPAWMLYDRQPLTIANKRPSIHFKCANSNANKQKTEKLCDIIDSNLTDLFLFSKQLFSFLCCQKHIPNGTTLYQSQNLLSFDNRYLSIDWVWNARKRA